MKLKKLLAGALAAVVAVGSLSITAFAEVFEQDDWVFEEAGSSYWVVGYKGDEVNVTVPSEYNGNPVTAMYLTFSSLAAHYNPAAFLISDDYSKVETVHIPSGILYIDGRAIFGSYAFVGARNLTNITVDEANKNFASRDGVLYSKNEYDSAVLLSYPAGRTDYTYVIPDDVGSIHGSAFAYSNITKITIPGNVSEIGALAFLANQNLTEVIIEEGTTSIKENAFWYCTSLRSITIPASVKSIGLGPYDDDRSSYVFENCPDDLTIYGYAGTYAEEYAEEYEINFVALPITLEDEENETGVTVEGALPYGTVLNVGKGEETETSIAYDITLKDTNGDPVTPTGEVTVTIPVPKALEGADNYYVYYQNGDDLTNMKAAYDKDNGCVTFKTTHFSIYILSTVALTEEEEENNDGNNTGSGNTNTGSTSTGTSSTTAEAATTEPETQPGTSVPDTTPDSGNGEENGAGNSGSANGDNPHTGMTLLLIPAIVAAAGVIASKKRK